MSSTTKDFSDLYARAAEHLKIDVTKFEVNGEKLKEKLDLKHHQAFRVHKDSYNSSTPFPMTAINKITSSFRDQIVLQDLPRRDNKRNYTLTEPLEENGYERFFIFIVKNPIVKLQTFKDDKGVDVTNAEIIKAAIEGQEKERAWIDKCLKPVLYSSIKQAEIASDSIGSYSWVEKEEVEVPVREIESSGSLEPYRPLFLRSKGAFRGKSTWVDNGDGASKYVYGDSPIFLYTIVDRLDDVAKGMGYKLAAKMCIIEMVTGWKPVLLSKSKRKYFENSTHKEMSEELFTKITTNKENLAKLESIQNSNSIDALLSDHSYKSIKIDFPRFIIDEFKVRKPKTYNQYRGDIIAVYVHGVSKKNLLTQWESYLNRLLDKYPVLGLCKIHSYSSISPRQLKSVNRMIDMLDEQEKEKSFRSLPRARRERAKGFKNKNKRK